MLRLHEDYAQELLHVYYIWLRLEQERTNRLHDFTFEMNLKAREQALAILNQEMARNDTRTRDKDEPPYDALSFNALRVLEWQVRHLVRNGTLELPKGNATCQDLLAALCINGMTGDRVTGPRFRSITQELLRSYVVPYMLSFAVNPQKTGAVIPLRGSLPFAEELNPHGVTLLPFGICRDHVNPRQTKQYYVPEFTDAARACDVWFVPDPMGATGSTVVQAIEYLLNHGVQQNQIVVLALFGVPEFIAGVYRRYPLVRKIVVWHLGTCLNNRAYIVAKSDAFAHVGVSLVGDFGDWWMRRVGPRYAESHWASTGILPPELAQRILHLEV